MANDLLPLRAAADVTLGRQRSPDQANGPHMVRYLRSANVADGYLELADVKSMNFTPSEQRTFRLARGDVLISEGSGSLATVGASAVWNEELEGVVCFQNTLLRLRPRAGVDPRFLAWWCRHAFASGLLASVATGASIFHLGVERLRALSLRLPGEAGQRAIADYLDRETARIDALIDVKQRTISLLRERQASLIWEGVTKGIRPTGRFRESGLGWVGAIPTHWSVAPVYAFYSVQLGKMLNPERAGGTDLAPYVRNVNVQWDRIDLDDLDEMTFDASDRARYRLEPGDLLVCEGGEVGRAAVWQGQLEPCFYQKAVHRVRALRTSSTRFLMYVLWAAAALEVFSVEGNRSTIVHLTAEKLRAHRFPFPPETEQYEIISHLDSECTAQRLLITKLQQQLELLREYRQALITAAVTGQIEVT